MDIYNKEKARERIKEILDSSYERMYPFEIEKELSSLFKEAEENRDDEIKQEILWEIDLLNRTFGNKGTYQGKEVEEISNKWEYYLEADTKNFTKPFSNVPFCEWKKEAVEYYKKRFKETKSELSKARYAFAIMVFSEGSERLDYAKKSFDGWLKTGEKYIEEEVYNKEYYEMSPFAYSFSLKITTLFDQKDLQKEALNSLHKNIIKILKSGEKRWHLEFFEVESDYINKFDDVSKIKTDSVDSLKEIIKRLEEDFKKSENKNKSNHFLRHHIRILSKYKSEDEYSLDKKIAESYIDEAEGRESPLVKSSFFNDAIKYYKSMQGNNKYSNPVKKEEIDKKIDELTIKIKEIEKESKDEYKRFESSTTIKREDIIKIIKSLEEGNIFHNLLKDNSFMPKYNQTIESTKEIKRGNPLGFIIPISISRRDYPIIKHSSEEDIFDFRVRKNILIGIKIGSIMIKIALEELKNEYKINPLEKAKELISNTKEIGDIKEILERGLSYTLTDHKDLIAGIHILTPYFEEIIRRILVKAGKKDLVLKNEKTKYFRVIELGTLLIDEEVKKILGEDFQKTLKVLLVDNDQLNLRQDLAHGILTTDRITEEDTLYITYCLLKLIYILSKVNNGEKENGTK